MKRLLLICSACALFLLTSCRTIESDQNGAKRSDNVRLPYGASIGGVSVSRLRIEDARDILSRTLPVPEITLTMQDQTYALPAGSLGLYYDLDAAIEKAFQERQTASVGMSADQTVLSQRLTLLAKQAHVTPTDAVITVDRSKETPFTFQAESDGAAIDIAALCDAVCAAAAKGIYTVEIPTNTLKAEVSTEDLQLQTQQLASFSTSFAESPLNKTDRVFNIQKAAAAIHGTVLAPGEEFDCNAVLGDRTAENGWREAAAIRGGMYTTEYGGGVCQVSSTLFNAVMMADLTITERYPHSWPMRYVSIGRDATISTGGKNFRFVNEHETPVIIGMVFDNRQMTLTCTIYGSPLPKGEYIRIRSEQTATLDTLPAELVLDESLPLQTSITEREARRGKTSVTYKDYYNADGSLIRTEIAYKDTYRSIAARILVSTDIYYS